MASLATRTGTAFVSPGARRTERGSRPMRTWSGLTVTSPQPRATSRWGVESAAITVSKLQGNEWTVVSVPNGAQGAKRDFSKHIGWLEKFETVVLMFDNDEPGNAAVSECAALFTPGRCKVARLPLKDAN